MISVVLRHLSMRANADDYFSFPIVAELACESRSGFFLFFFRTSNVTQVSVIVLVVVL